MATPILIYLLSSFCLLKGLWFNLFLFSFKEKNLFFYTNSERLPDQMPHIVVSDMGLYCLLMSLSWDIVINSLITK